jgi:group I intron endonuclease
MWHKIDAKRNKNNKFYNAVRKYGWESFSYSIIAQIEAVDINEITPMLDSLEEQYILQYDSFNNGYNSTTGGHCQRASQMPEGFSEECRQRAKNYSKERIDKLLEGRRRYEITEEHRKRLSDVAKERDFAKYREIYAEKMLKNRKKALSKPVLQIDKEGKVVNEFPSMQEAVNFVKTYLTQDKTEYGIWNGIHRHCNNITKKRFYYGFEWKFKVIV